MITIVAKNFIGGIWHEGQLDVSTRNPAKLAEVAGQAHSASKEDVAYAVKIARKSLDKSLSVGPAKRADLVDALVHPMRRYATEIAKYLTHECGFTLKESQEEVLEAIRYCQFVAGQGALKAGEQLSWYPASRETRFVRRPVGVVACYPSWREPFAGCLKLALPSIIAGNTVIIKAPQNAIAISQWLARLILESGLGEGFVSVIHGPDTEVGDCLASEPDVQALTGDFCLERQLRYRRVLADRPEARLVSSPLGANGIAVFGDANVEQAAAITLSGALAKAGQQRSSTKVAWVAEPLFEPFVNKVRDLAKLVRVGDGLHESTTMGPLSNPDSFEGFLDGIGQTAGDVIVHGTAENGAGEQHLFATPHIVVDTDSACPYLGDGPSLLIKPLKSMEQLYGAMNCLSILTKSTETVRTVRQNVQCKRLLVNCPTTSRTAPNWSADIASVTRTLTLGIEA